MRVDAKSSFFADVVVLAGLHNFIRKESSEAERYIDCPGESSMYFCYLLLLVSIIKYLD